MKKIWRYKKEYIVIISICAMICIVIVSSIRSNRSLFFVSFPRAYNIVSVDNQFFWDIQLGTTQAHSPYFSKENITKALIADELQKEQYVIEITDIQYIEKRKVKDNPFHMFNLQITFPFVCSGMMKLEQISLTLQYANEESLTFKLGSLVLTSMSYQHDFLIEKLTGIVNEVNHQITLCGIIVQLKNLHHHSITIRDIDLMNGCANINLGDIKMLSNTEYANDTPISQILQHPYYPFQTANKDTIEIVIAPSESYTLLLPLQYYKEYVVTQTGIIFTYTIGDDRFEQIVEPFTFFSSTAQNEEVNIFEITS